MTLPDQSNLVRWGKASEKSCYTCGEAIGRARHLLVGCRVLLDRGHYSRRHDKVLQIIREAVSLSVATAQKGLTTNKRQINFVKEGSTVKSKSKPYLIISTTGILFLYNVCDHCKSFKSELSVYKTSNYAKNN